MMLESVFLQSTPSENVVGRDLSTTEPWKSYLNSFNTWMDQAQSRKKLSSGFYGARIGCVIFLTGTIPAGGSVSCPAPAVEFSQGNVLFRSEGKAENMGEEAVSLSVAYIAKE